MMGFLSAGIAWSSQVALSGLRVQVVGEDGGVPAGQGLFHPKLGPSYAAARLRIDNPAMKDMMM
jgi:hypothetical protein